MYFNIFIPVLIYSWYQMHISLRLLYALYAVHRLHHSWLYYTTAVPVCSVLNFFYFSEFSMYPVGFGFAPLDLSAVFHTGYHEWSLKATCQN